MAKQVKLNHNVMISGKSMTAGDEVIIIDDSDYRILVCMYRFGICYVTEMEAPKIIVNEPLQKKKRKSKQKSSDVAA